MPLRPGEKVGTAIRELKTGKTYAHTKKKFSKKRARKQALAIALRNSRLPYRKRKRASKATRR